MVLMAPDRERPVDVSAGSLRIRLAESAEEVRASQNLRYRVFCEEMAAKPTRDMIEVQREYDSFDEFCDHLLVFDENRGGGPESVVGTYRLMRREAARRKGQFYSVDEYKLATLINYHGEILELGRSCVDGDYRTGSTMHLLWRGIATYVFTYNIDLMFGCASLPGVEPEALAEPLSYLYHHHLAPPALRPQAVAHRYVEMNLLPLGQIEISRARKALPPLIKGYLRLGGFVGDGAVVDPDFGTTDICIVVKTDLVTERYYRHYLRDEAARNGSGN